MTKNGRVLTIFSPFEAGISAIDVILHAESIGAIFSTQKRDHSDNRGVFAYFAAFFRDFSGHKQKCPDFEK